MITNEGIHALNQINRYNGWTERPYSVLEHTLVGWYMLKKGGCSAGERLAFLIHDYHEVEYGDQWKPIIPLLTAEYFEKCGAFDAELAESLGLDFNIGEMVHEVDQTLRPAEIIAIPVTKAYVYQKGWAAFVPETHNGIVEVIKSKRFHGPAAEQIYRDALAAEVAAL